VNLIWVWKFQCHLKILKLWVQNWKYSVRPICIVIWLNDTTCISSITQKQNMMIRKLLMISKAFFRWILEQPKNDFFFYFKFKIFEIVWVIFSVILTMPSFSAPTFSICPSSSAMIPFPVSYAYLYDPSGLISCSCL
jgi:hypothetical protein